MTRQVIAGLWTCAVIGLLLLACNAENTDPHHAIVWLLFDVPVAFIAGAINAHVQRDERWDA